ncbi:MAG: hypothetical protein WKF54_12600 [Nocardioidaceae bacterium]
MRPTLRPGLHVLRRDVRTLQLGLEWPGVAALPDSPAVQAVLEAVDGFRDVHGVLLAAEARGVERSDGQVVLEALLDSGALVDQAVVSPPGLHRASWSAMWLLAGPLQSAAAVLTARRRSRVHVAGSGRVADLVRTLVEDEHVPVTSSAGEATVLVLAGDREPSRESADEAMRRGVPFLCVGLRELVGLVGPFVVPGRTACVRCVDLARSQLDPCCATLVESAQANPAPSPCGPASLVAVTAGYAAQEVAMWASGLVPLSCDHVIELPHGLGEVQTVLFEPHPECGCGWQSGQATMSA